jgi:hypothetical protein
MARIRAQASRLGERSALVMPRGIRVWHGCYTTVTHRSNAMHTLLTPPGDALTVYDYGHRDVRKMARWRSIDDRPAWLWSRHDDTISGWRMADRPLNAAVKSLFPVDWLLFGHPPESPPHRAPVMGRAFR